jgi:Polysaccharide lyase
VVDSIAIRAELPSRAHGRVKISLCLFAMGVAASLPLSGWAQVINTSSEIQTGFDTNTLSPMVLSATQSPNTVKVVRAGTSGNLPTAANGAEYAQFSWNESAYNGTRDTKGAEIDDTLDFTKEGWEGFELYVPSTGYPTDKTATVAQIFDNALDGASSWGGMLMIQNNQFRILFRGNEVAPTADANGNWGTLVDATVPRDSWVPIVIHFITSRVKQGSLQVWIGGAPQNSPTFSISGINFGYGGSGTDGWDLSTDSLLSTAGINLHLGMYNWDTGNYTAGETRTLSYDSVTQLVGGGAAGFDMVNPVPEPAFTAVVFMGAGLVMARGRKLPPHG